MRLSDQQMEDNAAVITAAPKGKKSVRFACVEVLEFRVGYTSCAVPTTGGPPVGLIGAPIAKKVYHFSQNSLDIEEEDRIPRGDIGDVWICPLERAQLLIDLYKFSPEEINLLCLEALAVKEARAVSRRDFEPAHVLRSCDLAQLQLLRDLRYAAQPVHVQREKVTLFDCNPVVGILA